ncbi:LANO_0E07910g1_1 [Lachancea nothofagi CBS 11611]|uniref:3-methyl-2-oxobutanoate hydroxymethyltransferase n=1 Tax=Lachancea nothofagi CBS 11611 TaxID=1266666 RepID=A0A1G4JUT4_9SACH|nr:LANO_0E07910g1_1 [Lachancea nothofagi CBS 11611]
MHRIARNPLRLLQRCYSSYPIGNTQPKTISDLYAKYMAKEPITMITAYDFITASWAQEANCDVILVGDSLAMCALGYESTTEIGLDEFRYHVQAVCRSRGPAFVMVDMPFGTFESSIEKGVETAISLMKCSPRVGGVKIEVGTPQGDSCEQDYSLKLATELCSRGIPVMGHIGLTPQRMHALSGFKVQGSKSAKDAVGIYRTAQNLQDAGCFSVLLECVPHKVSNFIAEKLHIPTIGIGAGAGVSGQVLVQSDVLGMMPGKVPKLAQKFGDLHAQSVGMIQQYTNDVTAQSFPNNDKNGFKIKEDIWYEFLERLAQEAK